MDCDKNINSYYFLLLKYLRINYYVTWIGVSELRMYIACKIGKFVSLDFLFGWIDY